MKVDNKEREWYGITEVYKVNGHIVISSYLPYVYFEYTI